jgi:ABC-2 type transport system permease protein
VSARRVALVGGVIAYRALFNWLRPAIYVPTMLAMPLFQTLFFAYLGRHSGLADDRFFVVGNAMQASAMAGVFGMVMTIANERQLGTLPAVLATPAGRAALFLGRALPMVANGVLVSAFVLAAGMALLDVRVRPAALPALAVTILVTVVSCTAFGLAVGAVGLRARDLWVGSNLAYYLLLLLSGANVPPERLPGWLAGVGRAMPLTHGIEAARGLAAGARLADVAAALRGELVAAAAYAVLGSCLLRLFEAEGRRHATLDTL